MSVCEFALAGLTEVDKNQRNSHITDVHRDSILIRLNKNMLKTFLAVKIYKVFSCALALAVCSQQGSRSWMSFVYTQIEKKNPPTKPGFVGDYVHICGIWSK